MTIQQAQAEFRRLCEGLGGNPKGMSTEEKQSWTRVLEGLSYERGRAAVTRLIDTWKYRTFPRPGALADVAEKVSFEGQANAGAYSQNGHAPTQDPEQMRRVIEQQDRWLAMDDEDYFAEVQRLHASGAIRITGG